MEYIIVAIIVFLSVIFVIRDFFKSLTQDCCRCCSKKCAQYPDIETIEKQTHQTDETHTDLNEKR